MAVITYKVCDICGKEIKHNDDFYEMNKIIPVFNMNVNEHLCNDCFSEMKEWIKKKKERMEHDRTGSNHMD